MNYLEGDYYDGSLSRNRKKNVKDKTKRRNKKHYDRVFDV